MIKLSSKGFTPIIILIGLMVISLASYVVYKQQDSIIKESKRILSNQKSSPFHLAYDKASPPSLVLNTPAPSNSPIIPSPASIVNAVQNSSPQSSAAVNPSESPAVSSLLSTPVPTPTPTPSPLHPTPTPFLPAGSSSYSYVSPSPTPTPTPVVVSSCVKPTINYPTIPTFSSPGAVMYLSPAAGIYAPGETFDIYVKLNIAGLSSTNWDVMLDYNPSLLNVISVQNLVGTNNNDFGSSAYDNTTGLIFFSYGSSSIGSPTSMDLAKITFQAVNGNRNVIAPVNFRFDPTHPNATNDTNVVNPSDITEALRSVVNASFFIGNSCN